MAWSLDDRSMWALWGLIRRFASSQRVSSSLRQTSRISMTEGDSYTHSPFLKICTGSSRIL